MTLTVGSLFSGIGGLDLGLERAGMRVVWQSEIDPYCSKVLAKHWPDVPNLGDVTAIDWTEVPRVDVICGGYPCQPFSYAGRRGGESDARHLWPHMRDAIRVLRPRYALLENVPGHLSLGFGRVLGDLAEIGYDAEWDCIPAAAVGAPHLRWRIFVVAYPHREGKPGVTVDGDARRRVVVQRDVAHPGGERRQQVTGGASGDEGPDAGRSSQDHHVVAGDGQGSRTGDVGDPDSVAWRQGSARERGCCEVHEPGTFQRALGPSGPPWGEWEPEPDVGRVAHGVPHRVDRLRGLGNAVVPQVAEHVGRLIREAA